MAGKSPFPMLVQGPLSCRAAGPFVVPWYEMSAQKMTEPYVTCCCHRQQARFYWRARCIILDDGQDGNSTPIPSSSHSLLHTLVQPGTSAPGTFRLELWSDATCIYRVVCRRVCFTTFQSHVAIQLKARSIAPRIINRGCFVEMNTHFFVDPPAIEIICCEEPLKTLIVG